MKHTISFSAPCSPRHRRHKFLCSHGGKILPRPTDGQLKYIGGETRCISVPRGISFKEVMKRLTYLIDGAMILKYQLVTEDLDALVSVKSDEDVVHMFDEMDNYELAGCQRMHAFLFPVNHHDPMMESLTEPIPVEQHYIYSINGINTNQVSASTSPRSSPRPQFLPLNNYQTAKINNNNIPHQSNSHHHPQYYNNSRLVSVRSVGRSASHHHFYAQGTGSCAKSFVHHEHHQPSFCDTRTLERQTTLPPHF